MYRLFEVFLGVSACLSAVVGHGGRRTFLVLEAAAAKVDDLDAALRRMTQQDVLGEGADSVNAGLPDTGRITCALLRA